MMYMYYICGPIVVRSVSRRNGVNGHFKYTQGEALLNAGVRTHTDFKVTRQPPLEVTWFLVWRAGVKGWGLS
jgi:hypothetical protein